MHFNLFYGVDSSKLSYDLIAVDEAGEFRDQHKLANNVTCLRGHFEGLLENDQLQTDQTLICVEDTGMYSFPLIYTLHQLGFAVWVVDAYHLKNSIGRVKGKTDEIDAKRIAKFARRNHEDAKLFAPSHEALVKLKSLISQRSRLLKAIHSLTQGIGEERLFQQIDMDDVYQDTDQAIANLKRTIKALEKKMDLIIKQSHRLSRQAKILLSIPGIGPVNLRHMLVLTQGFTKYTNGRKMASLTGVAPFPRQSGKRLNQAPRSTSMGRKDFKASLTMAALSLIGSPTSFGKFYERKIKEGKAHLCVINALRNKLIHTACACIRNDTMYQEKFHLNLHKP